MVTLSKYGNTPNRNILEIVALSTDEKPTTSVEDLPIENGSTLFEMDTKKAYIFDAENKIWYEI